MNKYHVQILVKGEWVDHPSSPVAARSRKDVSKNFECAEGGSGSGTVKIRLAN